MIESVISFTEMQAQDMHGIVQLVGKCGATMLVERVEGIQSGYVTLRSLETGKPLIAYKTKTFRVVTNVQSWDDLSTDDQIDIELDLMTRGL